MSDDSAKHGIGLGSIVTRSDFDVEVIQQVGTDEMVARAAMVSTGKDRSDLSSEKMLGMVKFLMKNRHGTPFEHGLVTMRINAPIFIWREYHRHRIGHSFNEQSGRYTELAPVFYVPGEERRQHCLKPPGFKPSSPSLMAMLAMDKDKWNFHWEMQKELYLREYEQYQNGLKASMDNGLARIGLPVGIYSACYVTCNPRSLMAFLELRTEEENAARPSHPLWEMDQIARKVEEIFKRYWPVTHSVWCDRGRMAP